MAFEIVDQLLLIGTHFEEIVLFFYPIDGTVTDRVAAVFVEFVLREKTLFADRIPAFVFFGINLPFVPEHLQALAHELLVVGIGRANEKVVADIHFFPQIFEPQIVFVHVFLR